MVQGISQPLSVEVGDSTWAINLIAQPIQITAGQSVNFTVEINGAVPPVSESASGRYSYQFSFGDNSQGTGFQASPRTSHQYLKPGVFRAYVTVGVGTFSTIGSGSEKSGVQITVLSDQAAGVIPNLIGKPEDEVRRMFDPKMEFSLGSVTSLITADYPAGTVIRQQPAPGTRAPNGTKIDIVVARTAADRSIETVTVPSVIRMPLTKAIQTLEAAGLVPGLPQWRTGRVSSQSPPANTKVLKGTVVRLN